MKDTIGTTEDENDICLLCRNPFKPGTKKSLTKTKYILTALEHFRSKQQEYFITLTVDSGKHLITRRIVTIGTLDSALVHPREVYAGAIKDRAAGIIIAHNHPSGDAHPSKEDIKTTQQLIAAGLIMGIPLIDHYIVSATGYYSFKNNLFI